MLHCYLHWFENHDAVLSAGSLTVHFLKWNSQVNLFKTENFSTDGRNLQLGKSLRVKILYRLRRFCQLWEAGSGNGFSQTIDTKLQIVVRFCFSKEYFSNSRLIPWKGNEGMSSLASTIAVLWRFFEEIWRRTITRKGLWKTMSEVYHGPYHMWYIHIIWHILCENKFCSKMNTSGMSDLGLLHVRMVNSWFYRLKRIFRDLWGNQRHNTV